MWPFKKKAFRKSGKPLQHEYVGPTFRYPTKCRSCGGTNINAPEDCSKCHKRKDLEAQCARKTAAYGKLINDESREAKEGKMKLSVGSEYIVNGAKHVCTGSFKEYPYDGGTKFKIGNWNYYEDGRPCSGIAPKIEHELLKSAPTPLTLIPGELYAMENGKVERATIAYPHTVFLLGCHMYDKDGSPRTEMREAGPKILHRLRVNEHMKGLDPDYTSNFVRRMGVTIPAMQGEPVSTRAEALSAMPRVTYRNIHSETEACKREVVVPEGFELVPPADAVPGDLTPEGGVWTSISTHLARIAEFGDLTYIRPIKKHFKVTGPGWYRTRGGGWIKDPVIEDKLRGPRGADHIATWKEDGAWRVDHKEFGVDLIARATPEQAQILDAL